jgi:PEP-CTERM motif
VAGPTQATSTVALYDFDSKIAWARCYDGALSGDEVEDAYLQAINFTPVVPEPGSWILMGLGLATLGAMRARRAA